jgi:hypothetical protein
VIKLDRAQEHLRTLVNEVAEHEHQSLKVEYQQSPAEPGVYRLRFRQAVPPPDRWSAVIGDLLHNVRSALDSFTFTTIDGRATLSDKERRRIYFPITETIADFEDHPWPAKKIGSKSVDAFRSAQPWARYLDLDDEYLAQTKRHPLVLLSKLSNIDKHRALHLTFAAPIDTLAGTAGPVRADWTPGKPWPLEDGDLIGTWTFTGLNPDQSPWFDNKFRIALESDAQSELGMSFDERLASFVTAAWKAIEEVESGLPPS